MKFTLEPCKCCGREPSRTEVVNELQRLRTVFIELHEKFSKIDRNNSMPVKEYAKLYAAALKKVQTAGKNYMNLKREYNKRFRRSN